MCDTCRDGHFLQQRRGLAPARRTRGPPCRNHSPLRARREVTMAMETTPVRADGAAQHRTRPVPHALRALLPTWRMCNSPLVHIPAVVIVGNTLTLEEQEHWYTPAQPGRWNMRLARRGAGEERHAIEARVSAAASAQDACDKATCLSVRQHSSPSSDGGRHPACGVAYGA
jgi:hypothetical protein